MTREEAVEVAFAAMMKQAVKTNADHIRNMSDEELAVAVVLLHTVCELCAKTETCDEMCGTAVCVEGVTEWLKKPYKEDGNG